MNPSAILAAIETAKALRAEAQSARDVLLSALQEDLLLADATRDLLSTMHLAVASDSRHQEIRGIRPALIGKLQPLAASHGFTLSLTLTNTVVITAN